MSVHVRWKGATKMLTCNKFLRLVSQSSFTARRRTSRRTASSTRSSDTLEMVCPYTRAARCLTHAHSRTGNFHALLLLTNDEELETAHAAVARMVHRAIALDGTCTGEHCAGMGKRDYLYEEPGEGTAELMKTIKKAIDPLNLFNPGKVGSVLI